MLTPLYDSYGISTVENSKGYFFFSYKSPGTSSSRTAHENGELRLCWINISNINSKDEKDNGDPHWMSRVLGGKIWENTLDIELLRMKMIEMSITSNIMLCEHLINASMLKMWDRKRKEIKREKRKRSWPYKHKLTKWCKIIEVSSVKIHLWKWENHNKYTILGSIEIVLKVQIINITDFNKKNNFNGDKI